MWSSVPLHSFLTGVDIGYGGLCLFGEPVGNVSLSRPVHSITHGSWVSNGCALYLHTVGMVFVFFILCIGLVCKTFSRIAFRVDVG
jgi:hypothetical protein